MSRKSSRKKSEPATLLPDWAMPGIVLLGEGKTPIEKGYTHNCAARYMSFSPSIAPLDPARRAEILGHIHAGQNVGWSPPPGIIVIDADNESACQWLEALMPTDCPQQRRTKDKGHWYCRVDESFPVYTRAGLKIDVGGRELARIDVRTWGNVDPDLPGGGYVVIPPSKHDSGQHYAWARELPDDPEKIPMISESVKEVLAPLFTRGSRARSPRAAGEFSRHDQLLAYSARAVRYESKSDPVSAIARVVEKTRAFAAQLYADDPVRLRQESEDCERYVATAWDQWGGDAALDEQNLDLSFAGVISGSWGDPWIYCPELGQWYEWNGVIWEPVHQKMIEQVVTEFPSSLLEDALRENDGERRKKLVTNALSLSKSSKVTSVVLTLQRIWSRPESMLDANVDLMTFPASESLGVPAMTVNLETGESWEPRSEDYITKKAGAPYAPDYHHPICDQYWETSFPDPETRSAMQEILGISLCGRIHQERIYLMNGGRGSGKGTLGFSAVHMLGDYAKVETGGGLIDGKSSQEGSKKDFGIAQLRGMRLIYFDEFDGTLGEKALALSQAGTVEGPIKKVQKPIRFQITHSILMSKNGRPGVRNPEGFRRRLREIPMNGGAPDPDHPKDSIKHFLSQEEEGLTAMLAAAVRGLNRARMKDFEPSWGKAIEEASAEWVQESNKIGEWLAHGCEVTHNSDDYIDEAFKIYTQWMDDQGMHRQDFKRAASNEFSALMKGMGFESKRVTNGVRYYGLKIRSHEETNEGKVTKLLGFKKKS